MAPVLGFFYVHYNDVIIGTMASQITSLTIVNSTVFWGAGQRKHQSSASQVFVRGIHRGLVNSPHKWPVTRKMFPFDDVIIPYFVASSWTEWALNVLIQKKFEHKVAWKYDYNTSITILMAFALRWRDNERDGVSNHQPHDFLSNVYSGADQSKYSPFTGEFPAQRASNVETVSIWWHHHGKSTSQTPWPK